MDYKTLAAPETVQKTMQAVEARGINVVLVDNKAEALAKLKSLIPAGAPVITASSQTLTEIGLDDIFISGEHPWINLKTEILAEKDPVKQTLLRKQATLADYYLGSVNALAETGEIVFASATGSQLPAYAFSSSHVIWVAGVQKITPNLEQAIRRVREYVAPLVDQQVKQRGGSGTTIGKLMIFEREVPFLKRQITLILVNEVLGL
ncbi:MAG: lactate utilization protein [Anaerolineales bacterium]